jgi:hypothetical protein
MLRARWRHDASGSSVLLIGARPFGEVSAQRGKPSFHASLLLPTGLQKRVFAQREAAEAFLLNGVEDYVLLQLTPAARTVLLRLSDDPAPAMPQPTRESTGSMAAQG